LDALGFNPFVHQLHDNGLPMINPQPGIIFIYLHNILKPYVVFLGRLHNLLANVVSG
jgi:hypothetical protein